MIQGQAYVFRPAPKLARPRLAWLPGRRGSAQARRAPGSLPGLGDVQPLRGLRVVEPHRSLRGLAVLTQRDARLVANQVEMGPRGCHVAGRPGKDTPLPRGSQHLVDPGPRPSGCA